MDYKKSRKNIKFFEKIITVDVIYGTGKLTTFDGNQYKEVISKFAGLLKLPHSINKILEFLEKKVRGETLFCKKRFSPHTVLQLSPFCSYRKSGFTMSLADFGCRILDPFDHVMNILIGQAGMHRKVGFPFVEEFRCDRTLIGIISHSAQTGKVEGGLIMKDRLDPFFLIQNLHEFISGTAEDFFIRADGVEMEGVIAIFRFINRFDTGNILQACRDLVGNFTAFVG